jgi:NADH dehydrogenase
VLVEAAASLLTSMPSDLGNYACIKLRAMGVEVLLKTRVVGATAEMVELHDGMTIASHTLFWSAGVAAAELAEGFSGVERAGGGRIIVQPDLSIKGHPEVFVIGDMACCLQDGAPLPMMAPVASQQGRYVARTVLARERGERMPPFRYFDKGSMATIGRSSAVAITGSLKFRGFSAWLVWLVLHLFYLIGFRNRLMVVMNWAYYYFFHERQVRLITADKRRAAP